MIIFLTGSKVSGAPGVEALTKRILAARLHLGSEHRLFEDSPARGFSRPDYATIIPDYLSYLVGKIARWRGCRADKINYEHIGALCDTFDIEYGTARNAALAPFWTAAAKKFAPSIHTDGDAHEKFAELNAITLLWIRHVVRRELTLQRGWSDAATEFLRRMPVTRQPWATVTLNHDLILEDAFSRLNIPIETGFGSTPEVAAFNPTSIRNPQAPLLLKLHGSINWFLDRDRQEILREGVAEPDSLPRSAPFGPEINVGTFNKLEAYSSEIYPFLFAAFDRVLSQARAIIISGYGFMDDGVSSRIFNELRYRPSLRILVIHPKPDELIALATPFARHHFARLKNLNQITWVGCKFEEVVQPPFVGDVLDPFVAEHSA